MVCRRNIAMLSKTSCSSFRFPEDFGSHHRDGLASPWALQELRQLQGVNDARRGAPFLCRLADSEYRRPLGFLSNMDTFCSQLSDGWPTFFFRGTNTCVRRPFAQEMPCHSVHKTFEGARERFQFSSTVSLGFSFWARVLPWRLFCKSGTDARRALTSLLTGSVIFFLEHGIAAVLLDSLSPLSISVSPTVSAPILPSRVLSLKARSRTPRRCKTPLVLLEPR